MSDFRVAFCVSGQGRLFREAVRHGPALGIVPELLIADDGASPDLEPFCDAAGIHVARLSGDGNAYRGEIARACDAAQPDLLCLTFDRILPPEVVGPRRGAIINVHLALLPAFRGRGAIDRALETDVRYAGATIHEVTEEVDRGPIVAQCVVATRSDDTAESLGRHVYELLRPMYLQVLAWYAEDRVARDRQGRIRVRGATYGKMPVSPALERDFPAVQSL